jgi:hypothetical protein
LALAGLASGIAWGAPEDFELPGSQPDLPGAPPAAVILDEFVHPQDMDPADFTDALGLPPCSQCHTGVDPAESPSSATAPRPLFPWQGSMMAQAARDPVFFAQLDLANSDDAVRPEVDGIGDLCLRCHTPVGWLEGRSTQHDGLLLTYEDTFGVQCHACHRLVDPLAEDLPPAHFDLTQILNPLNPDPGVPPTYGNGMYVMDPTHLRRGPYVKSQMTGHQSEVVNEGVAWSTTLNALDHPVYGSPFHRSGNLCGTCHDVSLPFDCPDGTDVQACFPIERTWTEWRWSDYWGPGETGRNCQSCHMSGPLNGVAFGAPCEGGGALDHLNDIHVHDLTGGNDFVPRLIRHWKETYDTCDPMDAACADLKTALEELYPPAGGDPFKYVNLDALAAGRARVARTLARAAYLDAILDPVDPSVLEVTVTNRTGHKLPTGYPEGRRMWLNLRFLDASGDLIAESGRYEPGTAALFHDQNLDGLPGPLAYDLMSYTDAAGAVLPGTGRPTKVWEARLERAADGTEFHFALNDARVMDNRIPPTGWNPVEYAARRAEPVIPAVYTASGWQSDYEDPVDGALDRDESGFPVPAGTEWIELVLYYQTVSREYVEALAADNPNSLTAGGFNRGTLLLAGWEAVGRSEPVEMARAVVVVVDGDADGLPDGWEGPFEASEGASIGGANDDYDGDGHNNFQELVAGTSPIDAVETRKPVDIVLVLDMSGSMTSPAPKSALPKIDVLKDAVTLFLETWSDYAVPDDRLAVVYFRSTASLSAMTPSLVPFTANWEMVEADVRGQAASGWTAMGAGLYLALEELDRLVFDPMADDSRGLHILLFSNGMQNRSPIVADSPLDSNHLEIRVPGPGDLSVTGDSNPGLALPVTVLRPTSVERGPKIHTIGIGVADDPGGHAWHQDLRDIADKQLSHHLFVTEAPELEGTFLESLVETLRGNTLGYVVQEELGLAPGTEEVVEIPVHASAAKFSLVVSWSGGRAPAPGLRLERPDGATEPLAGIVRSGPFYRVITRYLDDPDHHPEQFGTWKLHLRAPKRSPQDQIPGAAADPDAGASARDGSLALRVHALLDEEEIRFSFRSNGRELRVGQPLLASARAVVGNQPLRWVDEARVTVERPRLNLGGVLARSDRRLDDPGSFDPDQVATPFSRKLLATFSDPETVRRLTLERETYDLADDGANGDGTPGDGTFSRELFRPTVPGHYRLSFRMVAHEPGGRHVERRESVSLFVRLGPVDSEATRVRRVAEGQRAFVVLRPIDTGDNLLGPGYAHRLQVRVAGARLPVEDLLDGRYRAELPAGTAPDETVRITLWEDVVHDGPVPEEGLVERVPAWLWWLLLLLLIVALAVVLWKVAF